MLKDIFQKSLETMLVKHAGLKKSTSLLISQVIEGILSYGSVLHKKMALSVKGPKVQESRIRKIERFFADLQINTSFFVEIIKANLNIGGKITIIIDGTDWKFGKKPVNILVAAGVVGNSAIPIAWEVLNKMGASSFLERKRLLKKLIEIIGRHNIEVVLADREFIGSEWLKFLHESAIPFIIRIRNNLYVKSKSGDRIQASCIMGIVKKGQRREIDVTLGEIPIRLAGTRSEAGEFVIVAASRCLIGNVLTKYRTRWLIELFFKSIKTKGFYLEETHMTDSDRISKLFALVAITCLLVVKVGHLRSHFKKIPIKNHGRPLFSVFTYGLDLLRSILSSGASGFHSPPFFVKIIELLFSEKLRICRISGVKNVGY